MSIYQIVVKGKAYDSEELRNIHHYEFFNYVPETSQLQELVDGIDTAYKSNLQTAFHDEIDFYEYDVRRVDVGDQPTRTFTATAGTWSGSSTADAIPSQVSAMVTFKALTAFPRSTRTYLFPFGANQLNSDGTVTSGAVNAMKDWADDMLEITITGGLNADKQAVKYGGDPRAVTDSNDLSQRSVKNVYATQRRRKVGVGS